MRNHKLLLLFTSFILITGCRNDIDAFDVNGKNYISPLEVYSFSSPAEGTRWKMGEYYEIKWRSSDNQGPVDLVIIKKKNYFETVVAESIPNTGTYIWQVPDELVSSHHYQVRINHSSHPDVVWYSPEFVIF